MKTNLMVGAAVVLAVGSAAPAGEARGTLELAGVTVTPHVATPGVRFRQPPLAPTDARVQLFLWNEPASEPGRSSPFPIGEVLFNGKQAAEYLDEGAWSWHDTPQVWTRVERLIPAGALVVWSFNSVDHQLGAPLVLDIQGAAGGAGRRFDVTVKEPRLWLSAVAFRGSNATAGPDRMILYVCNDTEQVYHIDDCRLFLPHGGASWRWLYAGPWLGDRLRPFSDGGRIEPSELGGARVMTGHLPLTHAAIQVRVRSDDGDIRSLWGYVRVRKEEFDISGGWVNSSTPQGPTLAREPFLKTLRRMHVNTAHIAEVAGYTDQSGPEGLYTRYPLKYFNRLSPLERYDTDALLPRLHAVEFLGEPQYRYGRNGKLPQQVWEALLPYAQSRLATTLTLSESQNWHLYAGVCDYAHYDAYRVTAPSPDSWNLYDRWGGRRIRWGAPLETIGEMTRSLRETSRPAPIACWSQGAHAGWDRYGGRARTSPTPDELRLQAYHALSSRITSLYWFNLSLKSLVKFRDLIDGITRVGREIRILEDLYLEGAAYRYRQVRRNGRPDWDLASVAAPDAAVLFALDLDYEADPNEKVFRFGPPRSVHFEFDLPPHLRQPKDVFRIDADGIYDVRSEVSAGGVRLDDRVSRVAIYVTALDQDLRARLEARRVALLQYETSFGFDPVCNDSDFAALAAPLKQE